MPDDAVAVAKQAVAFGSITRFIHEWLFSSDPYAYRQSKGGFSAFRTELATLLDIHAAEMIMVGSAQLGFSLNPKKLLRSFIDESDLDVVVVSSELFDAAWKDLLERSAGIQQLEAEDRRRFKKTQENFFRGYLRPDLLPTGCGLVKDWFPRLAGPFRCPVAARHPVKAWLFKSWWHAEHFYRDGITKVQPELARLLSVEREVQHGDIG